VNLLEGKVARRGQAEFLAETPLGTLRAELRPGDPEPDGAVTLAIRPEKVRLVADGDQGENRIRGKVEQVIYIGSESHYHVRAGAQLFTVYAMNARSGARELAVGEGVALELPAGSLIVLED
jgi:spermidine/putrescine transport system ATP-binding protein